MTERMRELFDAVVLDPSDREASGELELLLRELGDWTSLVNLYVHLAEHGGDPAAASVWLVQAAEVTAEQLDDKQRAVELYGASLEGNEAGAVDTLARMRALLFALENWDGYIQVAEAEVERIEDAATRAGLIFEMGEVLEERLGDQERAMLCYQAAFSDDPGCLRALYAARRIYRQRHDWPMVARLLQLELEATDDAERRPELLRDLGNVYLYDLDQPDTARLCFDQYLQLRPDDAEIRETLAELGGPVEQAAEVEAPHAEQALTVEPETVEVGDGSAAMQVELVGGPSEPVAPVAPVADFEPPQVEVLSDLAVAEVAPEEVAPALTEETAQTTPPAVEADTVVPEPAEAEAPAAEEPAAEEPAAEEPAAEAVPVGAEAPADVAAQVAELEARAAEAGGAERRELLVEAALALNAAGAGDVARAYLAAVKADPGDVGIYWRVGLKLQAGPEAAQAIAVGLDALIEAGHEGRTDVLTAHRLMFAAAQLDDGRTVDYRMRELAKNTQDPQFNDWNIQRLVETGKWRNLQQLLGEQAGGDPNAVRVDALREMARLAETRAADDTKAADFWRQVHQADKSDVEARRALLRLYEKLEKWPAYADVLKQEVDEIPESDVPARIAGLRQLVGTYVQHLRQDAMVVQLYGQILELDPEDEEAMNALVERYEAMRRWPELVAILQKQADRADGAARTDLNLKIARLYLEKFRNQAEAIKAYEVVLQDDPNNREAIEALDEMYEKRRDWDNFVAIRRRRADLAEEPETRLQAYKELADYANTKIRRPNICLELWEEVRRFSPGDVDALRALVDLYEKDKSFDALVPAIDELVDRVTDAAEQIDLLQKAGIVLQERMGDGARAVDVWQRLLRIDPEHRRAGDSLKKALIELGDWDALTEFFATSAKWDELVRILDGQVGVQKDDETRIDLLYRSARIYDEKLDQKDRAVRQLERVLQIQPDNLEGARALEPIYAQAEDHRKLVGVLEVLLGHETDPVERRVLMMRLSQLNEAHLRNPEGAFEWVRRVVAEHPGDAEARAELERLGGLTQHWPQVHDDLVTALDRIELSGEGDDAARLQVLLSLARILDEQMGAYEDALRRYHEALEIEADNRTALDAVEALYTRMMQWPELLDVLDRKLALADTVEARKQLLRKQGAIFETQLEDAASAIEKYRSITAEDEADAEALGALHRLYEAGEQHQELHDVLQRELALAVQGATDADAIDLKMKIGRIELEALGATADAVENFSAILDQEPDHLEARKALEGLLGDLGFRAQVARILEPIYRDHSEWESLVRSLEIQLEETAETEPRVELLERIGTLHVDRTADIERAFDAFARMLRETPESKVAIRRLTELADAGDRWDALALLLEEVVPNVSDDGLARALLGRLADIYENRVGDLSAAVDAHRRVLVLWPEDRESIEALDRLYLRTQQWPELLAIYRRKLELTEDAEARQGLQFQIANLLEEMLGDANEAILVYGEILEKQPENARALQSLDRLYEQEGMWPELADVLERQLELAEDPDRRIHLRVRLGRLHERELQNFELAIETYRTVLEASPDNEPALEALEGLIEDPEHRARIADILEPIYGRKDEWQKLIGIYEIQREETADDRRKVDLLHRIAALHQDRGGDAEEAFRSYARAFQVDPGDGRTLSQLHRIAEALDAWPSLVDVYEAQVLDIADIPTATDVHKRVARVLLEHIGDVERARGHYESAYGADDTDLEVIEALEQIYFQTEQWHELVAVVLRKAELVEDVPTRKELWFRVSALYEEMIEDPERAVEIYRMVLEADPVDTRSLDSLERIFLALERWEDLMEVLHKKAELTADLPQRKSIYYVIGAAYERELDDLMRAVETYKAIIEWDADDLQALQSLDRLYQRLEHWDDLLGVLKREVEVIGDEEEQLALRFRIARLHEVHLEDVVTAVDGYRGILADRPAHEPTLQALEGLVREDREAERAAAVLEAVLTHAGAWERMIGVWRDLLEVTSDLERRTQLRLRIGQAQEDMLADSDAAFEAYGEAFREDPTHEPALVALERVSRNAGLWQRLVDHLERELANIHSDFVARDLYLRVARVFEEELASNADAIERFRRVTELDPDHEGAILALDRLYQKEARWPELAEILRLEVERAEDAERVPLLLRLGALYENALEDVPEAITAYKEVLTIQAQEPEAVQSLERLFEQGQEQPIIGEVLEPIYLENEDWSRLHDLLQTLLAHQEPGEDRMRGMHRLAELALEKLDDRGRAFEWFGAAFQEVPEDEHSRREAARLAADTGRWADLVAIYRAGLQNTQDYELIRSVSHEMATVYRQYLDDVDAAEQLYRYVLDSIDPVDTAALKGLDELYEAQARWGELVDILQREIEATYDQLERTRFMFRLGDAFETRIGDTDAAVEQYRGITESDPHHGGALGRLERIYLNRQQWEELYEVYLRQSEIAEGDAAQATLFAQMANLAAEFLGRPEDAVDLWNKVLDLKGEDGDALMALEQLYQQQESWRELVEVCDRQVNLLQDDVEREIQLYAKLGRVWGDYLDRERNALENWHKVLDRRPDHEDALWAVRDLYERTGEHAEIAQTNHRLLDLLAPDHEKRAELQRQLGRLYQETLERPDDAIRAWTSLLTIESHDPEAIDSLEELYTQAENWESCVEILDRKVEIADDLYDKITILFRIAEMWEQQLQSPRGAIEAYKRVLELQADNHEAFEHLERLYEAGEQYEDLVGLLLERMEHTQDPFERLELFARTAEVFEQRLGSAEHAFLVLGRALEESRDDERFGADLERLAGEADKWAELIALYENVLQAMGAVPQTVPLHIRVAGWYDEKLDQPQHAGTHYQYVLAIEPQNVAALTALELLLERYENWAKVVEVLRQKVELALEPDERKASYEKMARILESELDQPDEAIEAFRQVLLIDSMDLPALQSLERLYALRQRWQDLIDVLEQQATALDDPESIVENHLRVAELWETRMAAPERAIDAYRQALAVDDRCADAMQALEKLYTQQERWHELLDVYEMMLQVRTEPADQLRIYNRIAMIEEEELGDVHATIDTYRKMVSVDPADATAVRALDRLYRDQERWDELAEVYQQHLDVLQDDHARTQIRTALADIYRGPLHDAQRAVEALTPVLDSEPRHRATLATLGELYAELEDWPNTIAMLGREAQLIQDRQEMLERQTTVGRIYAEKMGDLDSAEEWFKSALEHDPNHLPALGALKGIYEQRGDWNEVVRTLKMMEAATRSFSEKSEYLFEMGRVFDKHLGDRTQGIDYYEQAMDLSPDNARAADPLIAVYWEDERWERAEPLLDLLLRTRQDADLREQQELNYRLGFCAEQLHKDDKALTHYHRAYELDSTHLPTLRGMANLLFRREDWDRAFKIYQTVLVHHRESLEPGEIVEIFHRQGAIKLKVGERRKALDFFRKALDLEPRHEATLRAIVDLHESQGDWDDVIHYKRQLVPLITDDVDKFKALVSIADILHEQLRNTRLAVDAYNEALKAQPGSRLVLGKLMTIHEEAGNWADAVEVLMQLAEMEQDQKKQAKYYYAVAAIQRDYLKDHYTAVRSFDRALDADPTMLKAFEAIDKLLTTDRDYERQDRYYRKMLKRATEHQLDDKLIVTLAKGLGEINRSRLQKYEEAIKAYKIALSRKPDDAGTLQIMAELYELENRADKAIAQHYRMLELNPRNVESYQNLRRLFMDSGRYDEAWCVCQVLTYLGQANPDEKEFFERYRSRTLTQARKPLDAQHWALINHPEKSALLDQLFMRLYDYVVPLMIRTHKDLRLNKRRDLINPDEQTPFNNVLKYVSGITRLRQLECYRDPDQRPGIVAANLNPPAMLVGPDILSGPKLQELAFICAKQLYLMGKQHFLATLDDSYERRKQRLMTIVYTLTKLVNPAGNVPFHDDGLLGELQRTIPGPQLHELAKLIQQMSSNPQQHLNLSKWLEMLEHSSNRLGFLLSNDIGSAIQVIKNEQGQFSRAPTQDRVREIVLFALSENYFQLRKALGLAIG